MFRGDITERPTYQLDLVQPYFTISSNYNQNTKRNISKSIAMGVTVNRMLSVADYIQFKKKNLIVSIGDEQFDKLVRIMEFSLQKGIGEVYAAVTEQQELCAAAFFIRSNGKAIYLSAASNQSGKTNRQCFCLSISLLTTIPNCTWFWILKDLALIVLQGFMLALVQ